MDTKFLKLRDILISPRVWAAFLVIVFVLLRTFVPAIANRVAEQDVTNAVIALVAFIAASSIGAAPSWVNLIGTVKFWSLIVSLTFVFVRAFAPGFPIGEDLVQALVLALGVTSVGVTYRSVGSVR